MPRPIIPPAPTAPARTMDGSAFSAAADIFAAFIEGLPDDINAVSAWMDGVAAGLAVTGFTATSGSNVAMGTGTKTFTIQADRAFSPGQTVVIARTSEPTKLMMGTVNSYSGTTLAVNVTNATASGTFSDWSIALSITSDPYAYLPGIQGVNLLSNGGFEYGTGEWTIDSGGGTTNARDYQFGRVLILDAPTSTGSFPWLIRTSLLEVTPDADYTLSTNFALFASGTSACIYAYPQYFTVGGAYVGEGPIKRFYAGENFSNDLEDRIATAVTFHTPSNVAKVKICVFIEPNGNTIIAAGVRQMQLESGTRVSAYNDGATILKIVADLATKAASSGGTLTGPTINGGSLNAATVKAPTEVVDTKVTGTALTINLANGSMFSIDTTGNTTIALPAPTVGRSFTSRVKYGGPHVITWAGGARLWAGGNAPTPTSVSGKIDEFVFDCYDVAEGWLGSARQNIG